VRFKGTITDWNDDRGFGFIQPAEGGARVFLHIKDVSDRRMRPSNGKRVTYELGRDDRGRTRAKSVRDSVIPSVPVRASGAKPRPILATITSVSFLAGITMLALTGHLAGLIAIAYWGVSFTVFYLYWMDKWAAARGTRRTPESTLQLLALTCGWPGAWVAQQLFRHKTRKASFQTVFWFCVGLNCAALILVMAMGGDPTTALLSAPER
jgi:uncharacterized membrane protein YsdA (DUF1294 family)/cold shock CspA family protein